MRNVDADHLLEEIQKLEKTDWYLKGSGTCDGFTEKFKFDGRREAVEVIVELCIKREPIVEVTDDRLAKFEELFNGLLKTESIDVTTCEDIAKGRNPVLASPCYIPVAEVKRCIELAKGEK